MTAAAPASAWIPSRLSAAGDGVHCEWVDAAGIRFTDPFFETTLARCRRDGRARMTSTLDHLCDLAEQTAPVSPVFIFHVSRCGSTLLGQLFGIDERAIVLSEAPVLDDILGLDPKHGDRAFDAALRLLVNPSGPGASGSGADLCIVKTDCWHVFHAARIRRLYPDARFILLYRSPGAVLGSQRKARGMHMVPGLLPQLPFRVTYDPAHMSLDQYAAQVLARHYQTMLELAASDRHSLLVNYGEGFPDAFLRAAEWLGVAIDAAHAARARERCAFHAKRPQETFAADATPPPGDADLAPLDALFNQLEARRAAASKAAVNG